MTEMSCKALEKLLYTVSTGYLQFCLLPLSCLTFQLFMPPLKQTLPSHPQPNLCACYIYSNQYRVYRAFMLHSCLSFNPHLQSQVWVAFHSNLVLFVGTNSEAVDVSSSRHMQTHTWMHARTSPPKGLFLSFDLDLTPLYTVQQVWGSRQVCFYVSLAIWQPSSCKLHT